MEGNLKEIVTFLEGNFAEKKEIGRKPYVPKVEALMLQAQLTILKSFKHPTTFGKVALTYVRGVP